jgi:hypothetical protein
MNILRLFARLMGLLIVAGFVLIPPRLLINMRNGITPWGDSAPLSIQTSGGQRNLIAMYDPQKRPYTPASPWNTPLAANPLYDVFSAQRIATLADTVSEGKFSLDAERYTFTVYYADATTPRYDLTCAHSRCTVVLEESTRHSNILRHVPIPDGAQPSVGDEQMIIIDTTTGEEYGLYRPEKTSEGWHADNAYSYSVFYDGAPASIGARAAGVPYLAGLVRPYEIRRGYIDHTLAFGYPHLSRTKCVYPASKLDDGTNWAMSLPLGARIQLNPALTEADFEAMGLGSTAKILARAMQTYGMILVDYAGASKIYVEDLKNNPLTQESWEDDDLRLRTWALSKIPYNEFRVLALPNGYINPFAAALYHGDCYNYP